MRNIHSIQLILTESISDEEFDEIKEMIPRIMINVSNVRRHSEDILYLTAHDRARNDILAKIKDIFLHERD